VSIKSWHPHSIYIAVRNQYYSESNQLYGSENIRPRNELIFDSQKLVIIQKHDQVTKVINLMNGIGFVLFILNESITKLSHIQIKVYDLQQYIYETIHDFIHTNIYSSYTYRKNK